MITLIDVLPWYVGGVITGQILAWLLTRKGRKMPNENPKPARRFPYQAIVFVVVLAVLGYIMVSTNAARECAIKLNVSVSTEQDIAKIERDALAAAILQSQAVPQNIQDLPQSDPERKAVFDPITNQYLASMRDAADKRTANQSVRAAAQKACGS